MRRAARAGRIDWRAMRAKAEALLASLEIDDLAADQIVGALIGRQPATGGDPPRACRTTRAS